MPPTEDWPGLSALSAAIDIEASARASGAFERARGVPSAAALLRLALSWASGLSLRLVCALAAANGVARLADASLIERLTRAADWLREIAGALLAAQLEAVPAVARRLVLVDGTAICHPGADRTSWRLHLAYDPRAQRLAALELTDGRGAERLSRFAWRPGDVAVADRYYARPGEVRPLLKADADLIVRVGWNSLRLLTPAGAPFDLMAALDGTGETACEQAVSMDERRPGPPLRLRLIIARLPAEKAEEARRRLRRDATKRGRTPDARSLKAAGFVLLLTSLPAPAFPAATVLDLYRLRWQIEIAIKRLKSLLGLGALPAKNPALARAWLAAKLILALLAEAEAHGLRRALSPQAPGPPHPAVLASSPRRRTSSRQRCARPTTAATLVKACH